MLRGLFPSTQYVSYGTHFNSTQSHTADPLLSFDNLYFVTEIVVNNAGVYGKDDIAKWTGMKINELKRLQPHAEDRDHWRGYANPSYGGRHWTTKTLQNGPLVFQTSSTTIDDWRQERRLSRIPDWMASGLRSAPVVCFGSSSVFQFLFGYLGRCSCSFTSIDILSAWHYDSHVCSRCRSRFNN